MIVKKQMTLNYYKDGVLENKDKTIDGDAGFRTKDLMNYTTIQSKVALRNKDTKRVKRVVCAHGRHRQGRLRLLSGLQMNYVRV